jgi:hypothetical protein
MLPLLAGAAFAGFLLLRVAETSFFVAALPVAAVPVRDPVR